MCLGGGCIRKVMLVAITFLFSICIWGFQGIELENPEMAEEKVLVGIGTIQIPETETVSVETRNVERKRKRTHKKKKVVLKKWTTYRITAYCPCCDCSDKYGRMTSTGVVPRQGRTIAVDTKVIPYGSVVHIKGLGEFIAEDCGGSIKGNSIDLYFDVHSDTEKFGVQYREVYVERK